jgi:beta-glucuronidase
LHVPNDYYSYGGITRSVQMETLADLYVKQVHVTPLCEDGLWQAEIKVLVENLASEPKPAHSKLRLMKIRITISGPKSSTGKTFSWIVAKAWKFVGNKTSRT